jgi:DNA-binding transcriptional LysR family regulator
MMIEPSWNSGEWPKNIGVNAQAWIDKLLRRLLDEQLRWVESERLRTRCVLRLGPIRDETLNARPLGLLRMANAASSAYLARYGVPRSLVDLRRQEHRTVHFSTMLGARPIGWEYPVGDSYATLQLPGALHVNSAQTYEAAALAGLGLIQAPLLGIGRYLESGALVEILPDFRRRALAVSLVVAHRSNLSRRVRAFMKWIEDVLTPYLE